MLSQGKAVTHELYAELLKEAMGGSSGPFVIDGWPEDGPGVEALTEAGIKVTVAIALDVPAIVRSTRINERSEVSGWDYFSEEERNATDKNLTKLCKAYDTRWSTLAAALGSLGALRIVSCGGPVTAAADEIAKLLDGAASPGWAPAPVLPTVVSVIGAPGSGRSTACASVVGQLNAEYLKGVIGDGRGSIRRHSRR